MTVTQLLVAEILIVLVISGLLCVALVMVVDSYSHEFVRALIIR